MTPRAWASAVKYGFLAWVVVLWLGYTVALIVMDHAAMLIGN